jgi:hypothetical protein
MKDTTNISRFKVWKKDLIIEFPKKVIKWNAVRSGTKVRVGYNGHLHTYPSKTAELPACSYTSTLVSLTSRPTG